MGNTQPSQSRYAPPVNDSVNDALITTSNIENVSRSSMPGTLSGVEEIIPESIPQNVSADNQSLQTLEEHMTTDDNNASLASIRGQLNSYKNDPKVPSTQFNYVTPAEQKAAATSWKVGSAIAKSQKLVNSSREALRKAHYAHLEKGALAQAISNNVTVADVLSKKRSMPIINTKARISEINNTNFRQKQVLVSRLMYVIFFILYAIGLGVALASGFLTMRMLTVAFGLGLLYLVYSLLSAGSFWKTYGDVSMGIVKGGVKEVVTTVGPVKKCPARCRKVRSYAKHVLDFDDDDVNNNVDKYKPICSKQAGEGDDIYPYDYDYDDIESDSRNFRDCQIGRFDPAFDDSGKQISGCKDDRQLSFVCKWNMGTRPDDEPEYLNSSVPCHHYLNRVEVQNENL